MGKDRGYYEKYYVHRADGSLDHPGCTYFVLDLTHDPDARQAALAYARCCEKEKPKLAADLRNKVKEILNA